jgi:hypothetical protein
VLVAAVPFVASWAVYVLYTEGAQTWHIRPGEVLFFSLMISSIALGEIIELLSRDKNFTNLRLILMAYFFICIIISVLLYAMNVYHEEALHGARLDAQGRVLVFSLVLAGGVVIPGTVLEIVFDIVDRQEGTWKRRSWE